VIGGYNAGKVIQSLQCTQDVPTGFQDTSPPVSVVVSTSANMHELTKGRFYYQYKAE